MIALWILYLEYKDDICDSIVKLYHTFVNNSIIFDKFCILLETAKKSQ